MIQFLDHGIFPSELNFTLSLFNESAFIWVNLSIRIMIHSLILQWFSFWISKSFHQNHDSLPCHSVIQFLIQRIFHSELNFTLVLFVESACRWVNLSIRIKIHSHLVHGVSFWVSTSFYKNGDSLPDRSLNQCLSREAFLQKWDSLPWYSVSQFLDQWIFLNQ